MDIELSLDDTAPFEELLQDEPTVNSGLSCQSCGSPVTYSGRGRKPKFCADCKPTAPKAVRTSVKSVDILIAQMTDMYAAVGMGLSFMPSLATDSMIVATNASAMAESWRPLIERDPKIRKMWERMCNGGGWGSVIMSHGMVALAIMRAHDISLPGFPSQKVETNVN